MKVDWSGHLQTNLSLTNLKQPKYAIKIQKEYQRKLPFFPLLFGGQKILTIRHSIVSVYRIIKSNSMKKGNIGKQPWQDQSFFLGNRKSGPLDLKLLLYPAEE